MSDCGHDERFIDWEDHSQLIVCLKCEIERLRAALADIAWRTDWTEEDRIEAARAAGGGE